MTTLAAIAQVLAFLGTAALALVAVGAAAALYMLGRRRGARLALVGAGAAVAIYAALLVIVAFTSDERTIAAGAGKPFCEIDCHVVYDITSVHGRSDTMRLEVREAFDARTISPRRGDAPMWPGARRFALVDQAGHRWRPVQVRNVEGTLFARMRPGQAHRAELLFALPRGTTARGLLVEDDSPVSPLLIGHERSPFHRKTLLALPAPDRASR